MAQVGSRILRPETPNGPDGPLLTGVEGSFDPDEIIVSKTDLKGKITYANQVLQRVSQYSESELLGKPHNIIRHPDMSRCVFRFLWATKSVNWTR